MEDHKYYLSQQKVTDYDCASPRERKREGKRNRDRRRQKSRISIGAAFPRWRSLLRDKGFRSDTEVASFLLDRYESDSCSVGSQSRNAHVLLPAHLSESPRAGGANMSKINWVSLPASSVEKSIRDHDAVHTESGEQPSEDSQVEREVEIVGLVSIVYHDCLKQLAEYLLLPIKKCTTKDPVTSVECGSAGPFRTQISSQGSAVILQWKCPNDHCVWKWSSQATLKNGVQADDFMLASNKCFSGNGPRQPLERQESHFADDECQISPFKLMSRPLEADLGAHNPCEIVVEVNDCDEPPPAAQARDHSTAM